MYRENIEERIATAMKNGCKVDLSVWRAFKNEMLVYKTAKAGNEVTDDIEMKLIQKMIAQRTDSIAQYTAANRMDLAKPEQDELDVLKGLIPAEPTESEIRDVVAYAVEEIRAMANSISMKDMKSVQAMVKQKYPLANGGTVAKIFREFV